MFFIFTLVGIIIGGIFGWLSILVKREMESGNAEIINGEVQEKSGFVSGRSKYIKVNSRYITVGAETWKSVEVGDIVVIELAPRSREVFKVTKAEPVTDRR